MYFYICILIQQIYSQSHICEYNGVNLLVLYDLNAAAWFMQTIHCFPYQIGARIKPQSPGSVKAEWVKYVWPQWCLSVCHRGQSSWSSDSLHRDVSVTLGEQAVVCLTLPGRSCHGCCSALPDMVSIHRAVSKILPWEVTGQVLELKRHRRFLWASCWQGWEK